MKRLKSELNCLSNVERARPLPSKEELEKVLEYDPATGILKWKARDREYFASDGSWKRWNARYVGTEALGSLAIQGHKQGHLFGGFVKSHRVIWKLVTGEEPDVVDHANGIKTDNSWENLSSGSDAKNMRNKKEYSSNKSGVTGVYWNKDMKKWHAQIRFEGNRLHLGFFANIEDAKLARQEAQANFDFHANHGRKD